MTSPALLAEPTTIIAHESHVNAVRFSPDGSLLASAGMDNEIKLWSVPAWGPVASLLGHTKSVNTLAFTPDGEHLLSGSADRVVRVWSVADGKTVSRHDRQLSAVVSPDGDTVAAETARHDVVLWSVSTGAELATIPVGERIFALAFSPDGSTLVAAPFERPAIRWSVADRRVIGEFAGGDTPLVAAAFFDQGRRLAATSMDATLRIWSTEDWKEISAIALGARGEFPMAVSPDGGSIAVGSEHRLRLFDPDRGAVLADTEVRPRGVSSLAFSPDGRWLVMGGDDKRVRIWGA